LSASNSDPMFPSDASRDAGRGASTPAAPGFPPSPGGLSGPLLTAQGDCPYGLCDGSGFVVDEQTNTASDCRCRPSRIARARASRLEARIPRRYMALSFEQLEGDMLAAYPEQVRVVRRFVARISEHLGEGRSVWIEGDVGTGKTALAMMVSRAALEAAHTVAIYSLPRLLNLIRESIEGEGGVAGFLDLLSSVDLLHLDDVGAQMRTDWTVEQLYSLINARYEDKRSIVFTTNLSPDELAEQLGERIFSRLVEMCGDPLPLHGEDRRKELPLPASLR
jgi:DNA replication protein DnaC